MRSVPPLPAIPCPGRKAPQELNAGPSASPVSPACFTCWRSRCLNWVTHLGMNPAPEDLLQCLPQMNAEACLVTWPDPIWVIL